jgi:CheY-like chemotaxis protein
VCAGTLPEEDGCPAQDAVCVEVSDDGTGMAEDVRARVFEPFFTTKGLGRGTGLGLATSYAIVRDHRGTLSCTSSPGRGAVFSLLLPISGEDELAQVPARPSHSPRGVRVLLVDDDASVRSTLQEVLSAAGLTVFLAANGEEALRVLGERTDVQVVLLDRSMPGGTGERFIPRMRELRPGVRIAFLSGQTIDAGLAAQADALIEKPITGTALLVAIQQLAAPGRS